MSLLKRYWIEFRFPSNILPPIGTSIGCGITAHSSEDALIILKEKVFEDGLLPEISKFIEDVDISTLDANHVLPNMGVPTYRGVWFPQGY